MQYLYVTNQAVHKGIKIQLNPIKFCLKIILTFNCQFYLCHYILYIFKINRNKKLKKKVNLEDLIGEIVCLYLIRPYILLLLQHSDVTISKYSI